MATNWLDVWQSLSRRDFFRKTGLATGVMLVLGSLLDKASAQPVQLMQAAVPGVGGAHDYFLKIDGVEGESLDYKHKAEIDVLSFSWGATHPGKAQMEDMKFVMRVNRASPKLMQACATGTHFKGAILSVRKAGKDQQEYLKWTLTDVLVSSYKTGGNQGTSPADEFALDFSRIDVEYKGQFDPVGIRANFDLKMNKAM